MAFLIKNYLSRMVFFCYGCKNSPWLALIFINGQVKGIRGCNYNINEMLSS